MLGLKIIAILCFHQLILSSQVRSHKNHRHHHRSKRLANQKQPVSLNDVVLNTYASKPFNGSWISETEFFYRIGDQLYTFDVTTLEKKLFANFSYPVSSNVEFSISPDRKYILLKNSTENVYRHSSLSQFYIYNVQNKVMRQIENKKLLSKAFWAPKKSSLIYVFNNNIYYYEPKYDKVRQLTNDGELENVYNGISDWVYEEEVLATDNAMWISPTGEHLAFATFNDSQVHEAVILQYGTPLDMNNQYPKEEKYRYPKSGTTNPHVTLNLIDLSDHGSTVLPLHTPVDIVGSEAILFAVKWFDAKTVVATWTNRVQNQSLIVSYSLDGKYIYLLNRTESNGWLLYNNIEPLYYKNNVFVLSPQSVGNKSLGSFSHLVRYRLLNDLLTNKIDLTPGKTWVSSIIGVSDLQRVVYYMASPPNKPSHLHLYEASLDFKNSVAEPQCISCEIVTPEGNKCQYVGSVVFSKDFSHYILTCSGPDLAFINIYDYKHSNIQTWSDNEELREKLKKQILPKFKDLIVNSFGYDINIRLFLPDNLDETKKYPLLLNVYGGPESQRITDNFGVGYESYMTTNRQVAYALIDGRGSCSKGTAIMYEIYRNLGSGEIADQIYGVKKLLKKFSWIDKKKVGVWGWSYGGFASAMILTNDIENIFKCGVSVAPVVSWLYYDSIYTERYMGLPTADDNLKRYESNTVLLRAKTLKSKKFMLVHGTGDDNVHYQQSMMLSKVLAENDIIYEQLSYPDQAHHLNDVLTHLYHNLDIFWSKCFKYDYKPNSPQANNTVEFYKDD